MTHLVVYAGFPVALNGTAALRDVLKQRGIAADGPPASVTTSSRYDEDPETRTLIRTRYLCVLFFPVLALGSYRMGQTDQGWMILGREPISAPSTFLNIVTLLE